MSRRHFTDCSAKIFRLHTQYGAFHASRQTPYLIVYSPFNAIYCGPRWAPSVTKKAEEKVRPFKEKDPKQQLFFKPDFGFVVFSSAGKAGRSIHGRKTI